jgi:hypothetical protein
MAKSKPEKRQEEKKAQPTEQRVLPMQLQLGDRIADESGEYEVIGRPYTTNAGKDVHVRVQRSAEEGRRRAGPRAPRLPSTPGTVLPALKPLGYGRHRPP